MMSAKQFRYFPLFLLVSLLGLLESCAFYSTEVHLDNTICRGARWNPDHSKVAFISYSTAWRNEKVLDSSLSIFRRIALYMYIPEDDSLQRIFDYGSGPRHGRWSSRIAFFDSALYFKLHLYGGWKWLIREDSTYSFGSWVCMLEIELSSRINRFSVAGNCPHKDLFSGVRTRF